MRKLSEREIEILGLVAKGFTNKEIAQSLYVATNTVSSHIVRILEALEARDRTNAVYIALKKGMLKLTEEDRK